MAVAGVSKVKPLIQYINNYFVDGDATIQYRNYKGLLEFIRTMRFNIDYMDSEEFEDLINSCPMLISMIKILVDSHEYDCELSDDFFQELAATYYSKNISPSIDYEEGIYVDDESTSEESFKSGIGYDFNAFIQFVTLIPDKILTKEEEAELFDKYYNGTEEEKNDAQNQLIMHNLKLVVTIAKNHASTEEDFWDFVQEGYTGLVKTVPKYDITKGTKFSTYSWQWVSQKIKRYIENQSRTIRLPSYINTIIRKCNNISEKFYKEHGYSISNEELAKRLKISESKLNYIFKMKNSVSLDEEVAPGDNGQGLTLGDVVADNTFNPEHVIIELGEDDSLIKSVENVLLGDSALTRKEIEMRKRELTFLKFRYGYEDGKFHTLEQTGARLNMSRGSAKTIEERVLRRLRHYDEIRRFDPFRGNALMNDLHNNNESILHLLR